MARASEGSQLSFLPVIHTFICKWNEPYLPFLPSCRTLLSFGHWYSISHPAEAD